MKLEEIVKQLTLEEKASLCSGANFWQLKSIERLGLKQIMVTDGPHGLRKQVGKSDHVGLNKSVPATCFPTACATACSFDQNLLHQIGVAIGEECLQEKVAVLLGPGVNIKRNPLCGRNFEYISEDPYLTGELATALIQGVQSNGVGTSIKHFAMNNKENLRMISDSVVDERTMHEIYLAGFETAIKQAQPYTVMCSYNRINGTYADVNKILLTDILRDRWNFDGLVVSDWGAITERVDGVKAGLDLEMPGSGGTNDAEIIAAVNGGTLTMEALDKVATRVVSLILKTQDNLDKNYSYDIDAHHALARKAAAESTVLLQNDAILPLNKNSKLAVIGKFAETPEYQGAGSSLVNPHKIDNVIDELKALDVSFAYAEGYSTNRGAQIDVELEAEACKVAKSADVAIVFVGLPDDSEGVDRSTLSLPDSHNHLIHAVAEANPNTIVVLQVGGAVVMPWKNDVKGIVLSYLNGEANGSATIDILFGKVNPSAKLAETFPMQLDDVPCIKYSEPDQTSDEYRESIFVGYRYYDKIKRDVLFPFGFGLSYTSFALSNITISAKNFAKGDSLVVNVDVENTGSCAGAEVVQIYVGRNQDIIFRADKELKGFAKIFLAPSEKKTVSITLNDRSFSYYNAKIKDWAIEGGEYQVMAGTSSKNIALTETVVVEGDGNEQLLSELQTNATTYFNLPKEGMLDIPKEEFANLYDAPIPKAPSRERPFSLDTALGDMHSSFIGRLLYNMILKEASKVLNGDASKESAITDIKTVIDGMPIRALIMMSKGAVDKKKLKMLLRLMNGFRKSKSKDD